MGWDTLMVLCLSITRKHGGLLWVLGADMFYFYVTKSLLINTTKRRDLVLFIILGMMFMLYNVWVTSIVDISLLNSNLDWKLYSVKDINILFPDLNLRMLGPQNMLNMIKTLYLPPKCLCISLLLSPLAYPPNRILINILSKFVSMEQSKTTSLSRKWQSERFLKTTKLAPTLSGPNISNILTISKNSIVQGFGGKVKPHPSYGNGRGTIYP